jgi:hypothetical protein
MGAVAEQQALRRVPGVDGPDRRGELQTSAHVGDAVDVRPRPALGVRRLSFKRLSSRVARAYGRAARAGLSSLLSRRHPQASRACWFWLPGCSLLRPRPTRRCLPATSC